MTRRRSRNLVEPGDELQVLGHRQVAIEAEALRHVADLQPDARRIAQQVHAEAGAAAAIRAQQAAQHADGGGLAAAVAAEEAADLAFGHLQRQAVDHLPRAETLAQVVHVDGERGHRRTSTGWPGLSCTACSGGGCASIR